MEKEWLVVLNPVSGGGKGKKDKNQILKILDDLKFSFQLSETESPGHATEIVKQAIEKGSRKIMGVGGDGTVNEILQGIIGQKKLSSTEIAFGFIPVGTGNDWIRTIGIPEKYHDAARAIKTGHFFYQDVGVQESPKGIHYFANMAGLGYDAFVADRANRKFRKNKRTGKVKYLGTLFSSLLKYKHTHVKLTVDGEPMLDEEVFSMNIGIGRYNGNGMMQVPDAVPDDNFFDITVIRKISKMQVIRNTSRLYDGSHLAKDFARSYRGRVVEIESQPAILAETDGEITGSTPCRYTILPRAFKIISPLRNTTDFIE